MALPKTLFTARERSFFRALLGAIFLLLLIRYAQVRHPLWVLSITGQQPELKGPNLLQISDLGQGVPLLFESSGVFLVDINQALPRDFSRLPGIGPVLAERIYQYRLEHQKFTDIAELRQVPGIGPKKMAQIERFVVLHPPVAE